MRAAAGTGRERVWRGRRLGLVPMAGLLVVSAWLPSMATPSNAATLPSMATSSNAATLPSMATSSNAATLPPGFVETQIAISPSIRAPYGMQIAPDGRIFLLEQNRGDVRIVKNDVLLTTAFLDLVVDTGGSRGLISITFDPNFATNNYVYVEYTTHTGTTVFNRVSRFTANGDVAVAGSELVLFDGEPLDDKTLHYGGGLWFDGAGKLYMSTGDRLLGSNAQSLSTTWGKILRINPDGTIPTDNPFYNQTTGRNRAIWALGLRNPWQVAKEDATGRVFISDVGSATWEELNEATRGANYGHPKYEGSSGGAAGYTDPVWQYNHSTGTPTGCAIMGGDFYDPAVAQLPAEYVGTFIVADHCEGWVKSVDFAHGNVVRDLFSGLEEPVSIKVGSQGQIYYLQRKLNGVAGGGLFRVDFTGQSPLSITQQPLNQTTAIGGSVTFSVSATGGTGPITYQWQRNGTDIAGATSSNYTLTNAQPGDSGAQFSARVSDGTTTLTSGSATLTVNTNQVPVATIVTPAAGTTYAAGNTVSYSGTGTDEEDGDEPASRFTWEVVFHHNTHSHEFVLPYSGATSGSFVVPNDNEIDPDVWYRIHLTVTDSQGARTSVFRDVLPRTSDVTLQTSPAGLQLTLDGTQFTSPTTFAGVEGIVRSIGAPSPQALGATTYQFAGWSDGGGATHTIATPVDNTTYTATFTQTTAPQALFVVGSPATLSTDETVLNRLQNLGYVVTVVDDSAATAAAAQGKAIVLISSTVASTTVTTTFRDVSIPVLIWKPYLYSTMRLTGTVADTDFGVLTSVRTVAIQAISHPLAPRGAETITLTTKNVTLPWGRPGAGADIVGLTGTRATLFTYSPGDVLANGTPAPGCRAAFPTYKTALGVLTAAGGDLFDRTVTWMTGGCAGAP